MTSSLTALCACVRTRGREGEYEEDEAERGVVMKCAMTGDNAVVQIDT